jgi:transposase
VLGQTRPAQPRAGGEREALRALTATREGAMNAKRAELCQLRDLLVTAPEPLRSELRPPTRARLLGRPTAVRPERRKDPELRCAAGEACEGGLAGEAAAVRPGEQQLGCCERTDTGLVEQLRSEFQRQCFDLPPQLAFLDGQLLHAACNRSHREQRPASSGQTIRHRLSRGGDRQLNRALHTVILHRRQHDPATKAYIARRISEGKSHRDAVRLLKRYLARNLYRLLENGSPLST